MTFGNGGIKRKETKTVCDEVNPFPENTLMGEKYNPEKVERPEEWPDPPEPPEKRIIKEDVFKKSRSYPWKRDLIAIACVGMLAIYTYGAFRSGQWMERQNQKPVIQKEFVDKIQYVEKSKTPTEDFILFLNPQVDPGLAKIMADAVDKYSEEYKLPRKLIVSIMRKESFFNPFARSNKGAMGLMQVMPDIHKERWEGREKSELYHVSLNIKLGCNIFRDYLDMEKGNLEGTFHRYLGKKASKAQVKEYQNDIQGFWAELELYDYLTSREREEKKNVEETVNSDDADSANSPDSLPTPESSNGSGSPDENGGTERPKELSR